MIFCLNFYVANQANDSIQRQSRKIDQCFSWCFSAHTLHQHLMMDRNWSSRNTIYKFCLIMLMVGICPFLMGFSAPDWLFLRLYAKNGTVHERSFGLWEWCEGNSCYRNPSVGNEVVEGLSFSEFSSDCNL